MYERTDQKTYEACEEEGSILPLDEIDLDQVKTMISLAAADHAAGKTLASATKNNQPFWNAVFKIHYDCLHQLIEAYLRLERVKAKTHECLFATICAKHPQLELNWPTLERIRLKRNRSVYYGEPITREEWTSLEPALNLYIATFEKAVKERLENLGPDSNPDPGPES